MTTTDATPIQTGSVPSPGAFRYAAPPARHGARLLWLLGVAVGVAVFAAFLFTR